MRLLLHETLATAPFAYPLRAGWVPPAPGLEPEVRPTLLAADVGPDDVALVAAPEVLGLQETHRVVPDVAVVAGPIGSVALRVPVRPDGIERTVVRLYDGASGAAEFIARATLQPFYGIEPTGWSRADDAESQAVVVEGVEALRPPEAGLAEDLCRAWFILTGNAAVTHLLVAPLAADRATVAPALAHLQALWERGQARRRDLRHGVATAHGIEDRDRLADMLNGQRYTLDPGDRRAVADLLARGGRGSSYPSPHPLAYLGPEPAAG